MALFSSKIAFGLIMSIVCFSFDNLHIFAVSLERVWKLQLL